MKNLNLSNFLFLFILSGCTTSTYKVVRKFDERYEIKLTPDRIIQQCEYLYTEEDIKSHGFMFHILDEENTVLTMIQSNQLDEETCFERFKTLSKIFNQSKYIYITGVGDVFEKKVVENDFSYTFPEHGTFWGNGRTLSFASLTNDQGYCYDAHHMEDKPCPHEEYPMKEIE